MNAKPNNEFLVVIGHVLTAPDADLMVLAYPYRAGRVGAISSSSPTDPLIKRSVLGSRFQGNLLVQFEKLSFEYFV